LTFRKVLIANRGEIALRVIEACRELSLESVAVFSKVDAKMPYLSLAGERLCIGPAPAAKSYLNVPALISAAEVSGAEAIHPGYGFLAENPHFVEVCEEHDLTFIGPPREVMTLVGNKLATRETVAAVGVPVLPGEVLPENKQDWESAADRIGYPLMIKAVFGGGGRGMRIVKNKDELKAVIPAAKVEAEAAFGDGSLYLERSLTNPRHLEVQILADRSGKIVHLGERECSIQRRHQKLVEEAPAPHVDEKTRQALYEAALTAARALAYENVGTVEFILDNDGAFYFIEMNARIQVEHPISEVVTGVNLIKEQIRLAAGKPLAVEVDQLKVSGHAIECRINAENPARDFLPSCGRLAIDELPTGHGIRLDSHLYNGMVISHHYDSLLAKVIAWGHDREEARIRIYTALERFRVRGVATTCPLARAIVAHPSFRDGHIGTDFLTEILEE
jgi:acetyl-CoA carboxylase biotin carboxylase subunit